MTTMHAPFFLPVTASLRFFWGGTGKKKKNIYPALIQEQRDILLAAPYGYRAKMHCPVEAITAHS
jgi:hypothetical protein